MDLQALTLATFEPLVGEAFEVAAGDDDPLTFTLASAAALGPWPGGRDPFSLEFRGPSTPLLAQAIYRFEHAATGPLEIFVVPLGRDADGATYEAIFT